MRLWLKNMVGESIGRVDVRDDVFDAPLKPSLIHQVVVGQLANARQGTVQVQTRAGVAGGGRKPRPQKGTGASRAGSIRSPLWVGGGVALGPKPRSYRKNTPKRMRRMAMVSVISEKARNGDLIILESLELSTGKTKELESVIKALDISGSILLVADGSIPDVLLAASNIGNVQPIPANLINAKDLVNHGKILITVDGVRKIEELWGGVRRRRRALQEEKVH